MIQQIEIRENKKRKIVILILLAGVLAGFLAVLTLFVFPMVNGMPVLKIVIAAVVAFLPIFGIYSVLKGVLSSNPTLIINEKGITDNAPHTGVGFVPWSDIVDFKEATNFVKQKLLLFYLRNPIDYLSRIDGFKSGVLTAHYNQFGTPVVINTFDVDHDHFELKKKIERIIGHIRKIQ